MKKEDFGCIQYISKTNKIVLSYSINNEQDEGNMVIADMNVVKIKNDYDLMSCIYVAVNKSTNSISSTLKKYSNCTKLLSEGKQINFKIERENKKTFIMLPNPDNTEEEWVRIYPTTSPFASINKAALEYNKYIKENKEIIQE